MYMQKFLGESSIKSLADYLDFCKENYLLEFWIGGHLRPFDLSKSQYRWILFFRDLSPGCYKLCVMLTSKQLIRPIRPIRAYGLAFAPGEKVPLKIKADTFGYGFNITPAIATGSSFHSDSNTTEFRTRFNGIHQLGVTTPYWTDDVENTCFELMLLQNNTIKYGGNILKT